MKKFTRSDDNKILFGVFGGLGEYYQSDPTIIRLIAIFLLFISGFIPLILVYIIAIFMVPKLGEESKKTKKSRKVFLTVFLIFITIAIIIPILIMLFGFSLYKVSNTYQSLNTSPRQSQPENNIVYQLFSTPEYENIENYLNNNIISPNFDGQIFSHHHIFSQTEDKIYLWAYISEYYLDGIDLKQGTAISWPIVLYFSDQEIINYQMPGDGKYSEKVIQLFPSQIHDDILNFPSKNKEIINDMKHFVEYKAIVNYGI